MKQNPITVLDDELIDIRRVYNFCVDFVCIPSTSSSKLQWKLPWDQPVKSNFNF